MAEGDGTGVEATVVALGRVDGAELAEGAALPHAATTKARTVTAAKQIFIGLSRGALDRRRAGETPDADDRFRAPAPGLPGVTGSDLGRMGRSPWETVDSGSMTDLADHQGDGRQGVRASLEDAETTLTRPPVLLAIVAIVILAWLSRGMTFYHDEYTFILLRDLSIRGIFAPHNEHLSATLVVLYRVLLGTVGMASYWPYLGVTFALHLAVSGIVYVVVRREAPMAFALGAMAVMLVLGSGGDDILWAFQSGTIGATAAGMAALVVAPRRPAVAAILLTIALSTSGVGLAFFVGTGVHLLLTRPRALPWLLVPLGYYLTWFVLFATSSVSPGLHGLVEYVLAGLTASAAGALGSTSLMVGSLALLALAFGLGRAWEVQPVVLAMLASSVAFFAIAGLVRAQLGPEQAEASRYIYVAAPAFLIAGAILLARIPRPAGTVIGAVVLAFALVGNVTLLVESHDRLLTKVACEQALTPLQRGSAGNPC